MHAHAGIIDIIKSSNAHKFIKLFFIEFYKKISFLNRPVPLQPVASNKQINAIVSSFFELIKNVMLTIERVLYQVLQKHLLTRRSEEIAPTRKIQSALLKHCLMISHLPHLQYPYPALMFDLNMGAHRSPSQSR